MRHVSDLSKRQFMLALVRHGMTSTGFMGYVDLGIPGRGIHVSWLNSPGSGWRSRLSFLLDKQKHYRGDARRQECA